MVVTSLCGSENGRGRTRTESTTAKMTTFAPTQRASVSKATVVKPGFFRSWRIANLRSFITQCLHRIDSRGSTRRHPAREQHNQAEQRRDGSKRERIAGLHFVEQILKHAGQGE